MNVIDMMNALDTSRSKRKRTQEAEGVWENENKVDKTKSRRVRKEMQRKRIEILECKRLFEKP